LARIEVPPERVLLRASWLEKHKTESIRVVSYGQAESDAEQLSANLIDKFGRAYVRSLSFRAIPRGGLIVLGMVAYCLDLPASALDVSRSSSPVIIIDDCARSGTRFREFLKTIDQQEVIFAPLYSNSQLLALILKMESRVSGCVLACELRDLAHDHFPDAESLEQWRQFWLERRGTHVYWAGDLEHVVFPWSEPDRVFWNHKGNYAEDGWRFAPPDRCLRNRTLLRITGPRRDKAQVRLARSIAYNLLDDEILICNLDSQEVISLSGSSAEMWRALVFFGNYKQAIEHLVAIFDVAHSVVASDLEGFADELLARGVLETVTD
jgi:hypothetical protein